MSRSLARELSARGIDVTTVIEAGMLGESDRAQVEFARSRRRMIFTYNVADYYEIHSDYAKRGEGHAGMILVHQRHFSLGEQIKRVLKLVSSLSGEAMQNRVEFLSSWG